MSDDNEVIPKSHVQIVILDVKTKEVEKVLKLPMTPLLIYNNPDQKSSAVLRQYDYIWVHECPYCGMEQPRMYFKKECVPSDDTLLRLMCIMTKPDPLHTGESRRGIQKI
jgi:hypothetical protein